MAAVIYPLVVLTTQDSPKWTKIQDMAKALGLTKSRLFTLYQSFQDCEDIELTQNLKENRSQELFVQQVKAWPEEEPTQEDRANIYGRENI